MIIKRIYTKLKKAIHSILLKAKVSYSQAGEDIIIEYLLNSIGINKPKYIDIGANQPIKGNNTYLFYLKGCRGICIEPDISLLPILKKERSKDSILNIGISFSKAMLADFYYFENEHNAWNTFSKEDAIKKKEKTGIEFKTTKVELDTLNHICEKYKFEDVNLISIDVEGLDLDILKSIDFSKIKAQVICVETIAFSLNNTIKKNDEIISFMLLKNYVVYADTNLNTIFCRKDLF